ncbi:MAG: dihydroorotate dehydrogenase electron transfer subunit [Clostridium sp.]
MKKTYVRARVLENKEIANGIFKMVVENNDERRPGQFYMLKHEGGTLLPRPISICESNNESVTFLYAIVGRGTKEYEKLRSGDYISLIGPLGNGFNIDACGDRVALVGGGIGVAPLYEVAKALNYKGNRKVDFLGGFRDEVFLTEQLSELVEHTKISTNTGNVGHKGFVTEIFEPEKYDTVLCCGPEIMMKKVIEMCKEKGVKVYVSMEKHMACGVGACLVCTCKTKDGNKRTCKDGPVFDGEYVEL